MASIFFRISIFRILRVATVAAQLIAVFSLRCFAQDSAINSELGKLSVLKNASFIDHSNGQGFPSFQLSIRYTEPASGEPPESHVDLNYDVSGIVTSEDITSNSERTIMAFDYRTATHTSFICLIAVQADGEILSIRNLNPRIQTALGSLGSKAGGFFSIQKIEGRVLSISSDPSSATPERNFKMKLTDSDQLTLVSGSFQVD